MKYRAELQLRIRTKPLVVESDTFEEAVRAFRNYDINAAYAMADSLDVEIVNGSIVRVHDFEPVTEEVIKEVRKALNAGGTKSVATVEIGEKQ